MYNNRTLASYISIDSIVDFVIVKILAHIESLSSNNTPYDDTNIRSELSEYLDLIISM